MIKKWFPQMEIFSGQLKKYKVTNNDPLAENEKLEERVRASEKGKMKDTMERMKLESELKDKKNLRNGKHRGQQKQKRKGVYDKSGGITYDTAAFAFSTKDILKIRSRPRLEPGSDYHYLVRIQGVEP